MPFEGFILGESLAVDGCCLTCRTIEDKKITFDLIPETLQKTTAGFFKVGTKVNIERVLTLQKGLSGHLVSGHVDETGKIVKKKALEGGAWFVEVAASKTLTDLCIEKGSIAVDGISLTIIQVKRACFLFL